MLWAQLGHGVAGLTDDVLSLREHVTVSARASSLIDTAVTLAVDAYVAELTAILGSRATRDPLTGLPNRAAFDEALGHEVSSVGRTAAPTLLLLDLDKFKSVNDQDGHLAGDAVLIAVAEVLTGNLRPGDTACRLGGDEFAVVLPRTSAAQGLKVAGRLLSAARRSPGLSSAQARVSMSVGLGWLREPAKGADLIALADAALYEVKARGGDDVTVGEPAPQA